MYLNAHSFLNIQKDTIMYEKNHSLANMFLCKEKYLKIMFLNRWQFFSNKHNNIICLDFEKDYSS